MKKKFKWQNFFLIVFAWVWRTGVTIETKKIKKFGEEKLNERQEEAQVLSNNAVEILGEVAGCYDCQKRILLPF